MKKFLALLLAAMMVLSAVPAMATENNDPQNQAPTENGGSGSETAPAALVGAVTLDDAISVTGLGTGDKVNFYQVLVYDQDASSTGGWKAATGFSLSTEQIQKILGIGDYATGKSKADQAGIDATLAGSIAVMAQANSVNAKYADIPATDGTASQSSPEAGLYVALVDPGKADVLYNPVFVGADYKNNDSNTQEAVTTLSYDPAALAKKDTITLTKEIDGTQDTKYDVNVGDVIPFTISSKVPAFSTSYQNPTYVITDTFEDGLVLSKADGTAGTADDITVAMTGITDFATTDYTVALTANGFTVTLTAAGLAKVTAKGTPQDITVTYKAKITSVENFTVTEKENEATVKFSNNPEDTSSYSLLEDKTRNYSFTIDGNLLGYTGASYETDELIKTGLNADGSPATTEKKYHSGTTWSNLAPLQGALFTLYKEDGTTVVKTATSDANGRIKIEGLDAGVYKLQETTAPTGYIKDDRTFTITITATYEEISGGEYTNKDGILVKYDAYKVLKDYQVKVNDGVKDVTSNYTISSQGEVHHKKVDKATYQEITGEHFAGDSVTPISNTQGTQLPSTGGIGTTILYTIGAVLVLLAGVLLVSKRRAA